MSFAVLTITALSLVALPAQAVLQLRADTSFCRDGLEPALEVRSASGISRLVPLRRLEAHVHALHSRLLIDPLLAPHLPTARLQLSFDEKAAASVSTQWDGTLVLSLDAARILAAELETDGLITDPVALSLGVRPSPFVLAIAQNLVRIKALESKVVPHAWDILLLEEKALRPWVTVSNLALATPRERAQERLIPALGVQVLEEDWATVLKVAAPSFAAHWDAELSALPEDQRPLLRGQWLADVQARAAWPYNATSTAEEFFDAFLKAAYLRQPVAAVLFSLWREAIVGASLLQSPVQAP